jgi:hypothetical protein
MNSCLMGKKSKICLMESAAFKFELEFEVSLVLPVGEPEPNVDRPEVRTTRPG